MREFSNRRNPILPLEYHVPDSEGHVMPDGSCMYMAVLMTEQMFIAVRNIM